MQVEEVKAKQVGGSHYNTHEIQPWTMGIQQCVGGRNLDTQTLPEPLAGLTHVVGDPHAPHQQSY